MREWFADIFLFLFLFYRARGLQVLRHNRLSCIEKHTDWLKCLKPVSVC